jgi:DNA polymerase III sliding clamp (beta) subunit (PCNA family)
MQQQKFFIKSEIILKYLITEDDATDTLITCKSSEIALMTTDYDIYKALASVKNYDNFNFNKLKKLFEVVEVVSYAQHTRTPKPILKDDEVEKIRKLAIGK